MKVLCSRKFWQIAFINVFLYIVACAMGTSIGYGLHYIDYNVNFHWFIWSNLKQILMCGSIMYFSSLLLATLIVIVYGNVIINSFNWLCKHC